LKSHRHKGLPQRRGQGKAPTKASRPMTQKTPETPCSPMKPQDMQRLNRILSLAGIASRRKADELIREGRVMVNSSKVTEPGIRATWGEDRIRVDGKEIPAPSQRVYLMLNKPFGYICSLRDPEGRPVVSELLHGMTERVYPVGRLDFDTMGLLLLTNDGEWAHRLAHPRFRVPRTYKVTLEGAISARAREDLKRGVYLEDGFSGPSKVALVKQTGGTSVIRMTVATGKSRIVRRMAEAVGHRVIHLLRTGFGILELGDLKVGKFRQLEPEEVEATKKLVGVV